MWIQHPEIKDVSLTHVDTPLPIFKFTQDKEMNDYCKEIILEHREHNPQSTQSNVKAWHSSWKTHLENLKFQPIVDMICKACYTISSQYYRCSNVHWEVNDLWAMMYEKGEYTIRHNHFPPNDFVYFDFSSCYYVDVESDCSPIIFEDNFEIKPENGMLLIWQSFLQHEVPPTQGKRMGISTNIAHKLTGNRS